MGIDTGAGYDRCIAGRGFGEPAIDHAQVSAPTRTVDDTHLALRGLALDLKALCRQDPAGKGSDRTVFVRSTRALDRALEEFGL